VRQIRKDLSALRVKPGFCVSTILCRCKIWVTLHSWPNSIEFGHAAPRYRFGADFAEQNPG
jgi:hypothetical protein